MKWQNNFFQDLLPKTNCNICVARTFQVSVFSKYLLIPTKMWRCFITCKQFLGERMKQKRLLSDLIEFSWKLIVFPKLNAILNHISWTAFKFLLNSKFLSILVNENTNRCLRLTREDNFFLTLNSLTTQIRNCVAY